MGITVDSSGSAYVTGYTADAVTDFPVTTGSYCETHNGGNDVYVSKLNASGTALVYSTFLGGSGDDRGNSIVVDSSGSVYIAGQTSSTAFPTTTGAYDTSQNSGVDAFVTKLSADGTVLPYSTFLGGNGGDFGYGIAIDSSGSAYIAGQTSSANFPATPGVYDTSFNGAIDAFVTKLSEDGTSVTYSTFIGGSGQDIGYSIAVGSSGNAYVTGYTNSGAFPTTPGAFDESHNGSNDAFVFKLNADGTALLFSTFLGGTGADQGKGIVLDSAGNAYIIGTTTSSFPTTTGAYDISFNGDNDAFVTQLHSKGGVLLYSTYLGGTGNDQGLGIALDSLGNAYITGIASSGFPFTAGAYDTSQNGNRDSFVAKLALWKSPYLVVGNINAQYGTTAVPVKVMLAHPYDGSGISGKTLSVSVNGGASNDYTTDANGEIAFTYDVTGTNAGTNLPIVATFAGDATYDAKTATGQIILKAASVALTIDTAVVRANYRLGQAMSPQISVTATTALGTPISGISLDFTLDGTSIGSANTNALGVATLAHTPPTSLGVGSKPLLVSFAGTTNCLARSRSWNLTFSLTPTALALPAVAGSRNTNVNLVATLTNKDTSANLEGKTVKFFVDGSYVGQATTNASGVATLSHTLGGTAQKQTLMATFEGDDTFTVSSKTSTLTTK
jgi:hypothetical protein